MENDDPLFVHQVCMRPGEDNTSPIWLAYIKPLVDPFVGNHNDLRYCDEDEFHEIVWGVWADAGVDNNVTIEHELKLSTGNSETKGSRIDFLVHYDDGHRVGVEIKTASLWTSEIIQDQLVRYAETGRIDSLLLLTADSDLTEIDWPTNLEVPLFMVLLAGRRGLL